MTPCRETEGSVLPRFSDLLYLPLGSEEGLSARKTRISPAGFLQS